jgi:hypothetical protein
LYPNGRTLIKEKRNELLGLCQYIPPVHHPFYKELKGSDNFEDTDLLEDSDPED